MYLELRDVGHRFPGAELLFSGVTARISSGEVVALTGPSGSGKSTLLSIIAGWVVPAQGSVVFPTGTRVAWVLQNPLGSAHRTAVDHVVLPLLARGMLRKDALPVAEDVLARFGLTTVAQHPFRALSGGEAQRLMLARATTVGPGVLLVDEPTAQLDRANAATVVHVLANLASSGAAVIVATHDPQVRERCTRAIELGRI